MVSTHIDMNRRCAVKGNVKIIDFMPKGGGNAALLPWHTYWAETDQTRHGLPQKRKSHAGCHLEKVRLHIWISSLFWFYWVPHSTVAHLRGWWTLRPASEWSAKMCVPFDFPSPAAFLHFLQHPHRRWMFPQHWNCITRSFFRISWKPISDNEIMKFLGWGMWQFGCWTSFSSEINRRWIAALNCECCVNN